MTGALIVSGGSRGIGAATTICAARQGWDVAINYARDENAAASVADQVRSLGRRAIIVKGDDNLKNLVDEIMCHYYWKEQIYPTWTYLNYYIFLF